MHKNVLLVSLITGRVCKSQEDLQNMLRCWPASGAVGRIGMTDGKRNASRSVKGVFYLFFFLMLSLASLSAVLPKSSRAAFGF